MSRWKVVSLETVFAFIRNGKSIKQSGNDGFPITRIETISNGFIDSSKFGYANIQSINEFENYVLKHGDILMSHINSEKHLGKSAIFNLNSTVIHGMNLLCLRPGKDIDPCYAYYYFQSSFFLNQIQSISNKSVNQASFSVTNLKKLEILLPPLEDQQLIVNRLDLAQRLIGQRKEQIALMDELLQALFYEMFGDPVKNEKEWERLPLKEMGGIQTGNTPSRNNPDNFGSYIEWIKSGDIVLTSPYLTSASEFLSETGSKKARIVEENSILVCCIAGSRDSIGRAGMTDRKVAFNQQINSITPNSKVNHWFLLFHFRVAQSLVQDASTNSMKGMVNKSSFSEIKFILPPLPLQQSFADRVQQIEALKQQMQASLSELEQGFHALMQEVFET